MKPKMMISALLLSNVVAGGAMAADFNVTRSLDLDADSTEVWRVIGDFCDVDDWHPDITTCSLKVMDGRLHRVLVTTDGAEFVERRIASEAGLSYTYRLVSGPLPVEKYTATLSIQPGEGTKVTWSARFSSDNAGMEAAVAGLFDKGLAAIEGKLPAQ